MASSRRASALTIARSIRRNHGLEHATIHVLSERFRPISLAGHSGPRGFHLVGAAHADAIRSAVEEAVRRLQAGETWWAIHPGCGTNLAASSVITSVFAWLGAATAGRRARWTDRLAGAISLGALGAAIALPLGPLLQAHVTTSPDMRGVRIVDVRRARGGWLRGPAAGAVIHFVEITYDA